MDTKNDNLEYYIQMLTDNLSLVDDLSEEQVDSLINYLESEIAKKEELLTQLRKESE